MGYFLSYLRILLGPLKTFTKEHYGSETLREFLKLLPESVDMKKLKALSGDMAKLSKEDPLIQMLNYLLQIEVMVLN